MGYATKRTPQLTLGVFREKENRPVVQRGGSYYIGEVLQILHPRRCVLGKD